MSRSRHLRDQIRDNAGLRCSVKGCTRLRVPGRLVPFCANHARNKARFGDPKQARVEKGRLLPFLVMAKRFLRQHRSDEQVSAALATMQELLDTTNEPEPDSRLPKQHAPFSSRARGVKNPAWLVWREFHRLRHPKSRFSRRGVPRGADSYVIPAAPVGAEEALGAVLSVWIAYEMIGETLFTNDGVPLTYTLADALLTLRKAETNGHSRRPIAESTKQTVGQRLRDELGVFMLHAVDTIRAEEAARAERKALLRKPIEPHVKPLSEPKKGQPQRNEPTGRSFADHLATEGA